MFVREFGLIHNGSNPERFVRLVKWEGRWSAADVDGYESYSLHPTVWEWSVLDVRPAHDPVPQLRLAATAISELPMGRLSLPPWPKDATSESEELRRERIRVLRRASHVDVALGALEPQWQTEPVRAAA